MSYNGKIKSKLGNNKKSQRVKTNFPGFFPQEYFSLFYYNYFLRVLGAYS